ncbi:MAG TPA: flagellar basal body-associated FliL family protein [Blastocatellia bacterium]|nr:flagellar basal body-associated FliL family protein [Blastocatellia bacterium]
MSEAAAPAVAEAGAKKKKPNFIILGGLIVFLLLGGAGGYWFFIMRPKAVSAEKDGKAKKGAKETKEDSEESSGDEESASDKESEHNEESKDGEKKASSKDSFKLDLPDDKDVKKIIDLPPFIVNLADQGESYYLRLSVSVGIGESEGEKEDPLFTTRVRNAMLVVLTTKRSEDVLTQEGKAILRKELLKAARAASSEPKVEAIYITDLIVQL